MGSVINNQLVGDGIIYDIALVAGFEEWERFTVEYVDITFERNDPDSPDAIDNRKKKIQMYDMMKESVLRFKPIKKKDDSGRSRVIAWEYELFLKPAQRFEHYYSDFIHVLNNNPILHIQVVSGWYSGVERTVTEDMLDGDETIHWDVTDYKIVPDDDYNYTEITIKGLAPASHITKDSQPFSNKRT